MTNERWLRERLELVPEAFVSWLKWQEEEREAELGEAMARPLHQTLEERGRAALARARARPGRDRDSAFHLLAADAHITYACEAAADGPDPERALLGILRGVLEDYPKLGGRSPEGGAPEGCAPEDIAIEGGTAEDGDS